jgi:pimeloyl-ACP methyl ester carboxylesterase
VSDADAADLAVTRVGSGDPLVVFVHGVLGRGSAFDRVAAVLEPECEMLWYDRRGYGGSTSGAPPGIDGHIADLLAVLGERRAVLVGHSFGGVTAMGAAVQAPDLVDALMLYETSMAWVPGWDDGVMVGVLRSDDPEDAGLRMMLGERYETMSEEERARRCRDALAFIAEERSVRTGTPPFDVADIRAPVVYGRSGSNVMPMVLDYLQRKVQHVEVVTVSDTGHHAHRTAPEAFAGLVRRALELARSRSTGNPRQRTGAPREPDAFRSRDRQRRPHHCRLSRRGVRTRRTGADGQSGWDAASARVAGSGHQSDGDDRASEACRGRSVPPREGDPLPE